MIDINKYDVTDEDIADMLNLLTRMREKYGERYKDIIAVLYQLTEPNGGNND